MNRPVLVVVGAVAAAIVLAVVGLFAVRGLGGPAVDAADPGGAGGSGAPGVSAPSTAPSAGVYVDYSDEAIARADGRILLFFHASWCPQCRLLEDDIETEGVPAGVTIVKVDYDTNQDLRQRYGVTLQTTFVEVDADGEPLQTHVAYDEPRLRAVLDALL